MLSPVHAIDLFGEMVDLVNRCGGLSMWCCIWKENISGFLLSTSSVECLVSSIFLTMFVLLEIYSTNNYSGQRFAVSIKMATESYSVSHFLELWDVLLLRAIYDVHVGFDPKKVWYARFNYEGRTERFLPLFCFLATSVWRVYIPSHSHHTLTMIFVCLLVCFLTFFHGGSPYISCDSLGFNNINMLLWACPFSSRRVCGPAHDFQCFGREWILMCILGNHQ